MNVDNDINLRQEETRGQILSKAQDLFGHYGFSKTNVGDIAEACGMSPANIYRYFRNKQAIGVAVVSEYFRCSEAAMEAALQAPAGGAEDRLRAMISTGIGHIVEEMRATPKIVELAEFVCEDENGFGVLQLHIDWKLAQMMTELQRGIDSGEFRRLEDPAITAGALLNATKVFWMPFSLVRLKLDEVEQDLTQVLDLIFKGLRAGA